MQQKSSLLIKIMGNFEGGSSTRGFMGYMEGRSFVRAFEIEIYQEICKNAL
jgi:hypothetical protein